MALEVGDLPLHRQLFVTLRDKIERGAYDAGERLPSEQALCAEYGVSRITVRRALQDLINEGYLDRRRGLGSYVRARHRSQHPGISAIDALRATHAATRIQVIEFDRRTPPPSIADALHLPPKTPALYVQRVRSRGATPLLVTESWLPTWLPVDQITRAELGQAALFKILADNGITFARVEQEISAAIADPLHARLLRIRIGSPLLAVSRVVHDTEDRPVQSLAIYATPERTRIVTEYDANATDTVASGILAHYSARRAASHTKSD